MLTGYSTETAEVFSQWVEDARRYTLELVADLNDDQFMFPCEEIVNPFIWEIGHIVWFQERWILRNFNGGPSIHQDADLLFDSAAIPHDDRWQLHLPTRDGVIEYACDVRDRVREWLETASLTEDEVYFLKLSVFHEDMHTEAFTYMRQSLGYQPPTFLDREQLVQRETVVHDRTAPRDIDVPRRTMLLGGGRDEGFVFDNEKWEHPVEVDSFAISSHVVTQAQFAEFVDAGGYRCRELWSEEGWNWRLETRAEHPVYWRTDTAGRWMRRDFDRWVPLESQHPMVHVNWYEANAWCRWAGRRLPTEAEWEAAACYTPESPTDGSAAKRRYPWGNDPPQSHRANLNWHNSRILDTDALADGDSGFGLRQMLGNVWEWTSSPFGPFPEFEPDAYKEYSKPWFYTHKVLRGGSWATRSRYVRNTYRNYYLPDRRDIYAGFRTCALR